MSVVKFVDALPEQGTRGRRPQHVGRYAAEARELRKNKSKWGIIDIGKSSTTGINKGELVDFRPAGAYEATTRLVDGKRLVFARYVGKRTTPAAK